MPDEKSAALLAVERMEKSTSAYVEKFGNLPTLVGLTQDQLEEALQLLDEAVEYGVDYKTDAEFYEALGMRPPPEDALV
jgi:hypothetical protein